MMLGKECFCKALRMIKEQQDIDDQFGKALNMVGDGHFAWFADNFPDAVPESIK